MDGSIEGSSAERHQLEEILADAPSNWGRWGDTDEVGALNFQTPQAVLEALREVSSGRVLTLGAPFAGPQGEPLTPERAGAMRTNVRDKATYDAGREESLYGGLEWADDIITMYLQGTTHIDALGHAWYGRQIWNGYSTDETVDHMSRASVTPLAERGIVGRGVLIDLPRHRGRRLGRAEPFEMDELLAAAEAEGVEFRSGDVLLVRTGWVEQFYEDPEEFRRPPFHEPGLVFSPAVARWFHEHEIALYGTDTIANEIQPQPRTGVMSILHAALMRNLGIVFNEILWLPELAEACAERERWTFLYTAAPLKVVGGTGAPVNPIAIL